MILHLEDPRQVSVELIDGDDSGFHGKLLVIAVHVHQEPGIGVEPQGDPVAKGNIDPVLSHCPPIPDLYFHDGQVLG